MPLTSPPTKHSCTRTGPGTYLIGDQLADHQLGQAHDPLRDPSRVAAGGESCGSVAGFGDAGSVISQGDRHLHCGASPAPRAGGFPSGSARMPTSVTVVEENVEGIDGPPEGNRLSITRACFEGLSVARSAAKSTGTVLLGFSMPQLLTAPPRTGRCWTSTASRSWTPAASTLSSPPTEPREAPGADYDWQHPVPPSHASSRSSASGEGEAAGAGDPLARAETTAHTERAMQAKPVPCEPAHRVIPKECETRIRDGPTGQRAGSRGRSRSVLHRRGGRSPRREGATRP